MISCLLPASKLAAWKVPDDVRGEARDERGEAAARAAQLPGGRGWGAPAADAREEVGLRTRASDASGLDLCCSLNTLHAESFLEAFQTLLYASSSLDTKQPKHFETYCLQLVS